MSIVMVTHFFIDCFEMKLHKIKQSVAIIREHVEQIHDKSIGPTVLWSICTQLLNCVLV